MKKKSEETLTTNNKEKSNRKEELLSSRNNDKVDTKPNDSGQAELYSPEFAIKLPDSGRNPNDGETGMISLAAVKERLMEKLAAAPSVPGEALDGARRMLESVVRDVTVAAQAMSKDALQRIKSRLRDIVPSLSPTLAAKMVDDAEKEANSNSSEYERDGSERDQIAEEDHDGHGNHDEKSTPNSKLVNHRPSSRL